MNENLNEFTDFFITLDSITFININKTVLFLYFLSYFHTRNAVVNIIEFSPLVNYLQYLENHFMPSVFSLSKKLSLIIGVFILKILFY